MLREKSRDSESDVYGVLTQLLFALALNNSCLTGEAGYYHVQRLACVVICFSVDLKIQLTIPRDLLSIVNNSQKYAFMQVISLTYYIKSKVNTYKHTSIKKIIVKTPL